MSNEVRRSAVRAVAAQAGGKTVVIRFNHDAWPDVTGFLVQAERTGVRACVQNPAWTFMMTRQFICTPGQAAGGAPFWFNSPTAPRGTAVVATLKNSQVIAGSKPYSPTPCTAWPNSTADRLKGTTCG